MKPITRWPAHSRTLSQQRRVQSGSRFSPEEGVPVAQPFMGNTNHENMINPENERLGRVAECPHPQHGHVRG